MRGRLMPPYAAHIAQACSVRTLLICAVPLKRGAVVLPHLRRLRACYASDARRLLSTRAPSSSPRRAADARWIAMSAHATPAIFAACSLRAEPSRAFARRDVQHLLDGTPAARYAMLTQV